MKTLRSFAILAFATWSACALWGQTGIPFPNTTVSAATRIEAFPIYTLNTAPVAGATLTVVGQAGQQTYCYWAVTNYQVGAVTSNLGCVQNGPNTLTSGNYVQIAPFSYPAGTTGVDILQNSSPTLAPSGACNCAVATGVTSGRSRKFPTRFRATTYPFSTRRLTRSRSRRKAWAATPSIFCCGRAGPGQGRWSAISRPVAAAEPARSPASRRNRHSRPPQIRLLRPGTLACWLADRRGKAGCGMAAPGPVPIHRAQPREACSIRCNSTIRWGRLRAQLRRALRRTCRKSSPVFREARPRISYPGFLDGRSAARAGRGLRRWIAARN